jgi:DNA-binding response OmpR family regulator
MILEITLPGINGLQVCKNLRADSRTEKMKIITISGDLRYSESEVLGAGADSFFTKPVNFEILLSLCNDFLHLTESQK